MKVGIIGHGFVGKALQNGIIDSISISVIDPKIGNSIQELERVDPDIIFICVPTPMNKNNSQNIEIVKEVINDIKNLSIDSLIVLKSTVLPNHISEIQDQMKKFVYNPEFLRENFASEDFINSNLIVFGGSKNDCEYLSDFYKKYTKCLCKDHIFTDAVAASLIKYSINSFLSTKVIFFNELYKLFKNSKTDEDWEKFTDTLQKDERIGSSHMQVPGMDGRFGFGGACLPKDAQAFLKYSEENHSNLSLLERVIEVNNKIRSAYKVNTEREIEQNIDFSKKK